MFLCVDVEPDDHGAAVGAPWSGFSDAVDLMDGLRDGLRQRSGVEPHPTWFFRMDPAIAACYGSASYVVERHPELVAAVRDRGDQLGIHVHALRWDPEAAVGYSDYGDPDWPSHCVAVSAAAFEEAFGVRPTRARQGGYFLSEAVVDALVAAGVRVDLTPEPGVPSMLDDPSFGSRATAPSTNFAGYPRVAYQPTSDDAGHPAGGGVEPRPITLVPLTAYDYLRHVRLRSWAKAQVLGRRPTHRPLSVWKAWPSPARYWDLVAKAIERMERPYVALAIRTYPASSLPMERQSAALRGLFEHPLAERLTMTDPLVMAVD